MRLALFSPFCFLPILASLACDPAPKPPPSRAPLRIVSLAPALTEILFALGMGDQVVGVTDYCDYPPEARSRARVGGYANPSVEAILALHPDLVFVSPNVGNRDAALAVERAGGRLQVVPAETLAETLEAIRTVAVACGVEDRGRDLVQDLQARIDSASARVRGLPRVKTLFCVQVDPIIVAGLGTLPSELLELAGGSNIVTATRYPQIGIETVLAERPEVILQARMDAADESVVRGAMEFWSRWTTVPAVRNDRIVMFDATVALRPGPRVAEAVELLARLLHEEGPP